MDLVEKQENVKQVELKKEVTAQQNTLISIGEGVVSLNSNFEFNIVHGGQSVFEIEIDANVRILSVDDGSSNLRWQVVEPDDSAGVLAPATAESTKTDVVRLLRVALDYTAEGSFSFKVNSESQMSNTTQLVKVPSFRCTGVSRELGFLGIQAKTNVEIQPVSLEGVSIAKIDVSELPSAMRSRQDQNPILLAFKFLHSTFDLQLQVTKHGDVEVLVAAIDACWVDIVIVPEGKIAYSVRMGVRNTEKQFVRIDTHDSDDRKRVIIWSAAVAGNSVKPARDESGQIMIPLQKRNVTGSKRDDAFLVELSYMIERDNLGNRGRLNLILPKVDIPISQMFVKVFFPKNYTNGDFVGNIEEVKGFSKQEYQYTFVAAPTAQVQQQQLDEMLENEKAACMEIELTERMEKKEMKKKEKYNRRTSVAYSKPMYIPPASKTKALSNTVSGIVPIKVSVPRVGKEICFERLVVKSEHLKLTVTYKKNTQN